MQSSSKKYLKTYATAAGALSVGLCIFFMATHPERLPTFMFSVVFAVLYGIGFSVMMGVGVWIRHRTMTSAAHRRMQKHAAIIALWPTLMLILQSIGQLTLRDIIITTVLLVLLYFYAVRMAQPSPNSS